MHYHRWQRYGDPTELRRLPRTKCAVDTCDNTNDGSRELCSKHYHRFTKYGNATVKAFDRREAPFPYGQMPPICIKPHCNNPAQARGLCWGHYKHWYKYGSQPEGMPTCPVCRERRYRIELGRDMCAYCWRSSNRRHHYRLFWNQNGCLSAGRAWVANNGRMPVYRDWNRLGPQYPSMGPIKRVFGTWSNYLDALDRYIKMASLREKAAAYARQ